MRRFTAALAAAVVLLYTIMSWAARPRQTPDISPKIPTADRTAGNRVFLDHADILRKAEQDSFMVLVNNVVFTKGPMFMRCDSAHYFPGNDNFPETMEAFGNIRMEQGDTLFVYADILEYDGLTETATLYADPGKKVRLINRDVTLETDIFAYDMARELGTYNTGGCLYDPSNTLTSLEGEYDPNSKEANFYTDVHLNSRDSRDTLDIYSDTLLYNTTTAVAELYSPSRIINQRGTIFTSNARYETRSHIGDLYDRSVVHTSQGHWLTADTIYYNKPEGYAEAWGTMVLTDSAHHADITGDYGYYDQVADSTYITGHALVREYSGTDTLYLHARHIHTWRVTDSVAVPQDTLANIPAHTRTDTTHVAVAYPRVRFFRNDMQGIADSIAFTQRDSTMRMFYAPIIWNQDQQITGTQIDILTSDSTIRRATIPEQALIASHLEDDYYNQMAGKEMIARFLPDGSMRQLDINGSVDIIMYPEEADSTINKVLYAQSGHLTALFKGRATESIKTWSETKGSVVPLFQQKKKQKYLPKFVWYDDIRPAAPTEIFTVPQAQEKLMEEQGRANPWEPRPYIRRRPAHAHESDESEKEASDEKD